MIISFSLIGSASSGEGNPVKRQSDLAQLRRVLPASPPWEDWLQKTGELPPDFDTLPSLPDLPDPLVKEENGRKIPIKTREEWQAKREEIKSLFATWVIGKVPPPPDNLQARIIGEHQEEGATVREVELTFGPGNRARLWLALFIPRGDGPFPVFMTQATHHAWAMIALRRGYLACVYAGADSKDDTDTFMAAYPGYDWSRLTRRAWAAGRCVDYLAAIPQADLSRIALTGHSRNGKQSLIAGALDERFSVVISSSSGAGGAMSARYFSEQHSGEGIELLTRVFPDWFHPRLRFFTGREHKLPIDLHELVALIAPRPCLLSIALNDGVESTWAMQETYRAAGEVYRFLGAEERLRILWRPGSHETWPTVIEKYLDWCDNAFGRGNYAFPERLIHPQNWEEWKAASKDHQNPADFPRRQLSDPLTLENGRPVLTSADWEEKRKEVRAQVRRMLGEEPPQVINPGGAYGEEAQHISAMLNRSSAGEGLEKDQVVFGEYINGDIYLPAGLRESGRKAPVVLWLHPFSFSNGYGAAYRRGDEVFRTLARQGFVVFCFDQIGLGRRIEEVEGFYRRYPDWSLLGKMVRDARSALDAIAGLPYADTKQIWGLGYSLGSLVGLHLAAMDERLSGLISVCGPPLFRLDTPESESGGIRRWSHLHMLLPRLGFFIGQEDRIPYDVDLLYAAMAPRPLLVVSPSFDREASLKDVTQAIQSARRIYTLYSAPERLEQMSPEDYNRFSPELQSKVIGWLKNEVRK